jgi:hypothetical protein
MSAMTILYGDVAKLGDRPGARGVLSKLNDLDGDASLSGQISVVDRYRIMRFVKLISGELAAYGKLVGEIGSRYGEIVKAPSGFVAFNVRPECKDAYDVEKNQLDVLECEALASLKLLPVSAYEKIPLTPRDLSLLEKFVVFPVADADDASTKPSTPGS